MLVGVGGWGMVVGGTGSIVVVGYSNSKVTVSIVPKSKVLKPENALQPKQQTQQIVPLLTLVFILYLYCYIYCIYISF